MVRNYWDEQGFKDQCRDGEVCAEVAQRFTTAMKAWMPVAALLVSWGYDYADYEKAGVMPVTCKECEASDFYDGADLEIKHEPGCKLAEAEAGLETLRKMATGWNDIAR